MKMQPNKMYTVTKKIKLHTSPVREVVVPQTGAFAKETDDFLVFRGFRVRKACVVDIKEEEN